MVAFMSDEMQILIIMNYVSTKVDKHISLEDQGVLLK